MVEVSITLAEVSMIFGRTVMADVSFGRSVNWPMCHFADQSEIPLSLSFSLSFSLSLSLSLSLSFSLSLLAGFYCFYYLLLFCKNITCTVVF